MQIEQKAIHNRIGEFYFDEPDFDDCGGRTMRRVKVPKDVVRRIVAAVAALGGSESCG